MISSSCVRTCVEEKAKTIKFFATSVVHDWLAELAIPRHCGPEKNREKKQQKNTKKNLKRTDGNDRAKDDGPVEQVASSGLQSLQTRTERHYLGGKKQRQYTRVGETHRKWRRHRQETDAATNATTAWRTWSFECHHAIRRVRRQARHWNRFGRRPAPFPSDVIL